MVPPNLAVAAPFAMRASSRVTTLFHVCAIGTESDMLEFQAAAHAALAGRIQTFVQRSARYQGTMCEVLRHDAGKWAAILHLARLWQIDPSAICAVGDDVNDIPMIRNAGLGVAMGHARPRSWRPPTSSPAITTRTAWRCSWKTSSCRSGFRARHSARDPDGKDQRRARSDR